MAVARILLRFVFRLLAVLGAAIVLAGQAGRSNPQFDVLNAFLAPLLPLLAMLLAAALRWRDRIAAGVLTVGLLVAGYQLGGAALAGIGRQGQREHGGRELRLLTLSTWHANPDPAAIRSVIAAQAPDIVLLQETNGTAAEVVDGLLPGYSRTKSCYVMHCSLTTLSRWPARRVDVPAVGHKARPDVLVTQIDAPFGSFRIINVHLPRPNSPQASDFLIELTALARSEAEAPLVVAGDFNTATGSFGLANFGREGRVRRVDGFTPTYPAHLAIPAFIGIDHVFINGAWSGARCRRSGAGSSDHYGIACSLRLRPGEDVR